MTRNYTVNDKIDDRYRVIGTLGQGGHGTVYEAVDEKLGETVAVKILGGTPSEAGTTMSSQSKGWLGGKLGDAEHTTRLHRVARSMGVLTGTSAARVFAFNKSSDGDLYIVMEVLRGRDLETYLKNLEETEARIELKRLITLLDPVARALEIAHSASIIHQDLRPKNIIIEDETQRIRVLDFSLMPAVDPTTVAEHTYLAPEVLRGKIKDDDCRVDVYSLGAIVFRALAGRPPFDPTTKTQLETAPEKALNRFVSTVTQGSRPSLRAIRPEMPEAIDDWMTKALAPHALDRFDSIAQMWSVLRAIASIPAKSPQSALKNPAPISRPWEVEIDVEIETEVATLRGDEITKRMKG